MSALKMVHTWLVAIVLTMFPVERVEPNDVAAQETYRRHVDEVVTDIVAVAYDPTETPEITGDHARALTAAMITVIAAGESGGFNRTVELGHARGDGGKSWCLMQMNIGSGRTDEGWTGPDLISDRRKCLRSGMRAANRSIKSCSRWGLLSGLSIYDTGKCVKNEKISVSRMGRVLNTSRVGVPVDVEVFESPDLEQVLDQDFD